MRLLWRVLICLALTLSLLTTMGALLPGGSSVQAATLTTYDVAATDLLGTITLEGPWSSYTKAEAFNGAYARSSASDASVTIWFKGTEFHWIATAGTTTGLANVYVDGLDGEGQIVNLYRTSTQYQADVWHATLPDGLHFVKIVPNDYNAGTKFITIDAVQVAGNLCPPPPTITSLSPAYGPTSGGTPVVITGTNLQPTIDFSVTFGGVPARSYASISSTQLTAISPAHASGTVPVVVTTSAAATPVSDACSFTYDDSAPPTLNKYDDIALSFNFYTGSWSTFSTTTASGGGYRRCSDSAASVTIPFEGTEFHWIATRGTTMGQADIYVDGSPTKTATIDLHRSSPTYQNDVWSASLPRGFHTITITRADSSPAGSFINVDRVDIMGTIPSTKRIDAPLGWPFVETGWSNTASQSAWGGAVWQTNTGGGSVILPFTGMRYSLMVTTGKTFGKLRVTVDSQPSFLVDLYGSVTGYRKTVYTSPFLPPGNHLLTLEWSGEKNASATNTYVNIDAVDVLGVTDRPIISQLIPATGPAAGGNQVVLTGYSFTEDSSVYFGSTPAVAVTVDSANQIAATAPSGSGTVEVTVRNAYGLSVPDGSARYRYTGGDPVGDPPVINGLTPLAGSPEGGTTVTITGTGFADLTSVTFGGDPATNLQANGAGTQITCTSPAHAPGPVDVAVTTPAGTATSSGAFTYTTAPPTTTRVEQTSASLSWTGTWTLGSSSSYSGGSSRYIDAPGSVTIPFTGTYLALLCKTSPSYGMAKVTVDGTSTYDVNLYSAATLYKQNVFNTGVLASGLHWVKLEWTGTAGATGGGTNVNVDAVEVAGSLFAATRVEQSDGHLLWTPSYDTWTTGKSSSYSGGSLKYINKTGSVTINFTGIRLTLVVKRSTAYGYAKITLDGTTVYTVNLYKASTIYKNPVWSTPFLTFGNHTVKLEWTGTKGATSVSGSTNVNLDAVDVIGVLR
jgi:large repetitive protein